MEREGAQGSRGATDRITYTVQIEVRHCRRHTVPSNRGGYVRFKGTQAGSQGSVQLSPYVILSDHTKERERKSERAKRKRAEKE